MSNSDLQRSRNCVCVCVMCSATVRLKSVQSAKLPDRLKEKKPNVIDSLCFFSIICSDLSSLLPCLVNYPHTSRVKCHTLTCCRFWPSCVCWTRREPDRLMERRWLWRYYGKVTTEVTKQWLLKVLLCAFTLTKIAGCIWSWRVATFWDVIYQMYLTCIVCLTPDCLMGPKLIAISFCLCESTN